MSFSCSVPATDLADIPDVLDTLVPSPPLESEAAKIAFEEAKKAFAAVATCIAQNDLAICGSINGHWYDGASFPQNNITVAVSETATASAS